MNQNKKTPTKVILRPMERGQITLPIEIRKSMNITVDTWLSVEELDGKIILQPVNVNPKNQASNIIPAKRPFADVLKELEGNEFYWTKEDEKARLSARKAGEKKIKELYKKYEW